MGAIIDQNSEKIATRVAYGRTLEKLGATNKDIVVLDADLSGSTQTKFFAKAFPERFFNMGIAEANMMSTAAGLARAGKIPFASSFAMFATGRAWEQVRNSIVHNHLNVKVCASHSGVTVGEDGASHQIVEDIAIMRAIPHMTVIVPADATEATKATEALAQFDGPCYLRLGRSAVPIVFDNSYEFKIGKASTVIQGKDISIIACGVMIEAAINAAKELKENHGIHAEVINMATIKPIDREAILETVSKTKKVITAEEHNVIGGLGDAVASVLAEDANFNFQLKKVGIQDVFGQSGKAQDLLAHYGLDATGIVKTALKFR